MAKRRDGEQAALANGEVSAKRSVLCADHKRFFDTVKARVAVERL